MTTRAGSTGVVIPYYQRESGLLLRALRSILAQANAGEVLVVVVDDASPHPAREELSGLSSIERSRVQVIEQANAGPAGARNRALDALPSEVSVVAYLDSDDWWEPQHLERARDALDSGFNLYLCNWIPLESEQDAYTFFKKLRIDDHPRIEGKEGLHSFAADFFVQELTKPIGRLSTMVFERASFGDLRFEVDLRTACEDRIYRLELARRSPKIAFSTHADCRSGRGVNLFSGKPWGTLGHLELVRDELAAAHILRRRFQLAPHEQELVARMLQVSRRSGITTLARLWARRDALALRQLARIVAQDPLFPLLAPWTIIGAR